MATDGKDPRAMVELARLLARGRGGAADAKQAVEWLLKACEAGSPDALNALAHGVAPTDPARGAELFRRAAEAGHVPSMVELARRVGASDPATARRWLERAARAGDAEAALLLAAGS
jgi:TPR repeat protein